MIRIKDHKQQELFDPWEYLGPKRRRMLDESWPGLFREHLLCELPVHELKPFLRDDFGRPSKELYTLLGVLLFQQTMDLNDHEALNQLSFNLQWHYALNITEESDSAKYISEKTLWTWRQILTKNHLDQVIFNNVSDKLANVFSVNTDNQRMDSVHIKSNMRKLGRISIFGQTIHKFLINLKRHHRDFFDSISEDLIERYISKKALSAFSLVKPSESSKTLQVVSTDLYGLIEKFKDQAAICTMHSYKLMERVLNEQCSVDDTGKTLSIKKPKQIPADSLQNPSDPDSTYSGYKGQGYQVQVMETFTTTEEKEEKEQSLNLITHVAVEQACAHDSHALMPAIEDTQSRELSPKTVLADALYGSDSNVQSAKEKHVEVVSPVNDNGKSTGIDLSDFTFNDNGYVSICPAGHSPVKVKLKKKTERYNALFDLEQCSQCPHVEQCPIRSGKKNYHLRYSAKEQRLAVRRAFKKSNAFFEIYRWRAGVEATMSEYSALTGVKKLRVRGFNAVRYCATLKAAGLNLLRAAAVRRNRKRSQTGPGSRFLHLFMPFPIVKERIYKLLIGFEEFLSSKTCKTNCYTKLAA